MMFLFFLVHLFLLFFLFLLYLFLSRKGFSAPSFQSVKWWCAKTIYHSEIMNGSDSVPLPDDITAPVERETAGREP